ncbi:MAG: hypothetical protein HC915_07460 [Anaerolineae bacterium]|nr:hypothetical protein [Anaerolineae bacterium]
MATTIHNPGSGPAGAGTFTGKHSPCRCWRKTPWAASITCTRNRPFFNLYGYLLYTLFGARFLEALHWGDIALSAATVAMLYSTARRITGRGGLAWAIGLLYALNVDIYLYHAESFYTLLTTFWIMAAVFCLAQALPAPTGPARAPVAWLLGFVLVLTLLILTRSLYHLLLLAGALPFAAVLAGARWRRVLLLGGLISLLAVGWYAKNWGEFGFFGSSSWSGANLWKIARQGYTAEDFEELAAQGVIDPFVRDNPGEFYPPSHFANQGYARTSTVPVLAQDDYHNINYPAISQRYGENALRLIRHHPRHYLGTVHRAYSLFNCPTATSYARLTWEAEKIPLHTRLYTRYLYGQALTERLERWLGLAPGALCSVQALAFPLVLGVYGVAAIRTCGAGLAALAGPLARRRCNFRRLCYDHIHIRGFDMAGVRREHAL